MTLPLNALQHQEFQIYNDHEKEIRHAMAKQNSIYSGTLPMTFYAIK